MIGRQGLFSGLIVGQLQHYISGAYTALSGICKLLGPQRDASHRASCPLAFSKTFLMAGRKSRPAGPPPPSTTLVLDNGGDTIKAGFVTGDKTGGPRTIPNCLARDRHRKTYVGSELEKCKDFGEIAFRRPVEKGFIVNWETQKEIWDREFFDDKAPQRCDPSESRLLLAEQPNSLPALQTHCDQMAFEEFGFASYYRGTGPSPPVSSPGQVLTVPPRQARLSTPIMTSKPSSILREPRKPSLTSQLKSYS